MLLPVVYANPGEAPEEAVQDGVDFDAPTVDTALRLSCWINTQEFKRFSTPYDDRDRQEKFDFFLHNLASALEDGPPENEFMHEYTQACPQLASVACSSQTAHLPNHKYPPISHAVKSAHMVIIYTLGSLDVNTPARASLHKPGLPLPDSPTAAFLSCIPIPIRSR